MVTLMRHFPHLNHLTLDLLKHGKNNPVFLYVTITQVLCYLYLNAILRDTTQDLLVLACLRRATSSKAVANIETLSAVSPPNVIQLLVERFQ